MGGAHPAPEKRDDLPTPAELRCQVCGEGVLPARAIGCTRCGAPYHTDCFHYYGKCAIFGCGVTTTSSYQTLPKVVQDQAVEITESSRPEFSLEPFVEGMKRKFLTRAKDLPATIGAGLAGSLLTMGGFALFVNGTHHASLWIGLLFCGLGPGILAPFVAPVQHRRPALASAVSGGLFSIFYLLRFWMLEARFFWSVMTVAAGIFFATSLAEAVLGKLTPVGHALGRWAAPLRHIASCAFFLGSIVLTATILGEELSRLAIQEISVLSVLALVAAVPALELGKGEFERRQIDQGHVQRLPSRSAR